MEDNINWILRKQGVRLWTGCMWLRIEPSCGLCGNDNEPSSSIKGGEFLD
jgi:hypothetical protein